MRVVVAGRLEQRTWEDSEGHKHLSVDVGADDVGPSLRWATATIKRNERRRHQRRMVRRWAAGVERAPGLRPERGAFLTMNMPSGFSRQEWDLQGPRLVDLARRYDVDGATVDRLELLTLDLLNAKGPAQLIEAAGEVLDIVTLVLANRLSDSEHLHAEADLDLLRWAASDLARVRVEMIVGIRRYRP